ncbi:PREDICTED: D-beta-hydroxybutyrate dehydrogenase, mitochondrial-like, partial [Tauraco erythrolophus]|uniref:D-beta-hydroxybutyrate dehydrogenase, mitochondrial-like n=1 Tax=Tauraco erythrolophus TaxID=121530 RepID=UPI0005233D04
FWGLVNNAGISTFGETGWLSMEKYEKFADVNLLGSIRTTLAFLPLLRKYKGRIVFMSSIIAYFTLGNGIYSMTKAAIEKFCDALRLEMKKFGVRVCIIQPGNYARSTKIQPPVSAEEIWNELSEEEKAVYNKEYVQERANFFNSILSEGSANGNEVVDAMVDALTSPAPKARYMVAKLKEKALVFVCALFPTVVMDSVLSYALSKVSPLSPVCKQLCFNSSLTRLIHVTVRHKPCGNGYGVGSHVDLVIPFTRPEIPAKFRGETTATRSTGRTRRSGKE